MIIFGSSVSVYATTAMIGAYCDDAQVDDDAGKHLYWI